MEVKKDTKKPSVDLRKKAEKQLLNQSNIQEDIPPDDAHRLLHELRVHQIELEMQNEELRRAQAELEESQAKYFDLFDLAPVGYLTLSDKGLILDANLTVSQLLCPGRSSMLNHPLEGFIFRDDQEIYHLHHKRLMETGQKQTYELRMIRQDGSPFWVRMEVGAVPEGMRETLVYRVVMSDISEAKKLEQTRLALERQFLHVQKIESLGTLAGGIAHDFNNMLTAIMGNLELVLDYLSPESSIRCRLENAHQECRRAAGLIAQMLEYAGKGFSSVQKVDLSSFIQDNVGIFLAAIPKAITLNFLPAHDSPLVLADTSQLQQVVLNLITNAVEAIGKTAGFITVSIGADLYEKKDLLKSCIDEKPSPGRFVYLEISDTGCGMDKGTQSQIFEPFFTTKFAGRGLGMSAVLGIVRSYKGAIFVESKVERGTTIRIIFPVSETVLPESAQRGSTRENPPRPSRPISSKGHSNP